MSVYRPRQIDKIGVSYYNLEDETLYGGEFSSIESVQRLKYHLQPDILVTTAGKEEELHQLLLLNELDHDHPFMVKQMKRADFSTEAAIQRLRLLRIEDIASGARRDIKTLSKVDHTLLLKSIIDFQQTSMVGAMGGLILYLLQSSVLSQHDITSFSEPISIRSISSIPSSDVLAVDLMTMQSLGLFISDPHPNTSQRTKEGFSVFTVLNHTKTSMGARLLKQWLQMPLTDSKRINSRLDHVSYFTQEENSVSQGENRLGYDTSHLLIRCGSIFLFRYSGSCWLTK